MSNFGFFDLRLIDAYGVAYREAKSAVNASPVLEAAREFGSLPEALADCSLVVGTGSADHRTLRHRLVRLDAAVPDIGANGGRTAIVFGSEKFGLGTGDLDHCHWILRIPTRGEHGSMNLGQAVAVTLYELIRDESAVAPVLHHQADAASLARFESLLLDALAESGYGRTPATEGKVRRLIRRLAIPPHDSDVWQGMLRQILWKLRDNRD
jgi:tRNA/rRNA methyltransferase